MTLKAGQHSELSEQTSTGYASTGWFSSKAWSKKESLHLQQALPNQLTGKKVSLQSQQDLNSEGTQLSAQEALTLQAGGWLDRVSQVQTALGQQNEALGAMQAGQVSGAEARLAFIHQTQTLAQNTAIRAAQAARFEAGDGIRIQAREHDLRLVGSQLKAAAVQLEAAKNLFLESAQHTHQVDQHAHQSSGQFGMGASLRGLRALGEFNEAESQRQQTAVSHQVTHVQAQQQLQLKSGQHLQAGSGGYQIQVAQDLKLTGAVLQSGANSEQNQLTAAHTDTEKLENEDHVEVVSDSVSFHTDAPLSHSLLSRLGSAVATGLGLGGTEKNRRSETQASLQSAVSADLPLTAYDMDETLDQQALVRSWQQLGMELTGDLADQLAQKHPQIWGEGRPGRTLLQAGVTGMGAALGEGPVGGAMAGVVAGDLAGQALGNRLGRVFQGMPGPIDKILSEGTINLVSGAVGGLAGGVWDGQAGARWCGALVAEGDGVANKFSCYTTKIVN